MQELFLKSGAGRVRAVDWLENDFKWSVQRYSASTMVFLGQPLGDDRVVEPKGDPAIHIKSWPIVRGPWAAHRT